MVVDGDNFTDVDRSDIAPLKLPIASKRMLAEALWAANKDSNNNGKIFLVSMIFGRVRCQ